MRQDGRLRGGFPGGPLPSLGEGEGAPDERFARRLESNVDENGGGSAAGSPGDRRAAADRLSLPGTAPDRKSTRLNSSH